MAGELGVASEAVDRADLGEQLRSGDRGAAGQLEQCRCDRGGLLFEFVIERRDLAVERTAAGDKLAREPHLQLLLLACQPAADPLQVRAAAEHPQRHRKGRIERV